MMGLLNLGSLVLGLIAWILPVICLLQSSIYTDKKMAAFRVVSLSACTLSLFMQLYYNHHLVLIEDWSALMDTSGAVVIVSAILLIVTVILNIITLFYPRKLTN
ncbi:hypothetical protein [Ornithinibacillus scapharcae]|uniref:hypothetical protein n=1 Tax=Ornithinibacillus scapharcae TaxID=1147159 RepID=UPI000492C801|nr:hypothetical protein [Ornithinibacillus scapharcae]